MIIHNFSQLVISLSDNRRHHLPSTAVVAEFTEIDALPRTEVQSTISDRDVDAHTRDNALRVSWYIASMSPLTSGSQFLAIAFFRLDSAKLKQA